MSDTPNLNVIPKAEVENILLEELGNLYADKIVVNDESERGQKLKDLLKALQTLKIFPVGDTDKKTIDTLVTNLSKYKGYILTKLNEANSKGVEGLSDSDLLQNVQVVLLAERLDRPVVLPEWEQYQKTINTPQVKVAPTSGEVEQLENIFPVLSIDDVIEAKMLAMLRSMDLTAVGQDGIEYIDYEKLKSYLTQHPDRSDQLKHQLAALAIQDVLTNTNDIVILEKAISAENVSADEAESFSKAIGKAINDSLQVKDDGTVAIDRTKLQQELSVLGAVSQISNDEFLRLTEDVISQVVEPVSQDVIAYINNLPQTVIGESTIPHAITAPERVINSVLVKHGITPVDSLGGMIDTKNFGKVLKAKPEITDQVITEIKRKAGPELAKYELQRRIDVISATLLSQSGIDISRQEAQQIKNVLSSTLSRVIITQNLNPSPEAILQKRDTYEQVVKNFLTTGYKQVQGLADSSSVEAISKNGEVVDAISAALGGVVSDYAEGRVGISVNPVQDKNGESDLDLVMNYGSDGSFATTAKTLVSSIYSMKPSTAETIVQPNPIPYYAGKLSLQYKDQDRNGDVQGSGDWLERSEDQVLQILKSNGLIKVGERLKILEMSLLIKEELIN